MAAIKYGHCEENERHGGIQRIYRFENSNYGASVVRHDFSYSIPEKPWELAVLYNGKLCYNTYITNDVIGCLSGDEVQEILARIDDLRDPS
jgi:hypothetical protein